MNKKGFNSQEKCMNRHQTRGLQTHPLQRSGMESAQRKRYLRCLENEQAEDSTNTET